jgi:predicted RNA-binding Zn ribbon-like protein
MPASTAAPSRPDRRTRSPERVASRRRLWLDFVNTDTAPASARGDLLRDFGTLLRWLVDARVIDGDRAGGLSRRALLQPAAATATLVDARRVRSALRQLAEQGGTSGRTLEEAVVEINRVLGRSAGTRRLEQLEPGRYVRVFVPTGDAFAGLMIPIVESAADSLALDELERVHRCADPRCPRVFLDTSRNGTRRWCDMGTCGNRAKAARHRARALDAPGERVARVREGR